MRVRCVTRLKCVSFICKFRRCLKMCAKGVDYLLSGGTPSVLETSCKLSWYLVGAHRGRLVTCKFPWHLSGAYERRFALLVGVHVSSHGEGKKTYLSIGKKIKE